MAQKLSTQHLALNTVNLSLELAFLIACCKTNPSEEDTEFIHSYLSRISNAPSGSALGVHESLITAASQHGILPLVYKTIKNVSKSHYSLEHLLTALKSAYSQIARRNMLMSAELIRIMKLFENNGIEALAFKGPALSQSAYGDITLRQYGDLDILIKRSDISPMINLMRVEGYVPELALDTKMKETFLNALNVIGFYKSTTNVLIEVHWELLSKNYAIHWNENALWDQKRESAVINGTGIPVLPFEQQLLYLCVHGSKHLFERLEWICDIDRSIRVNPDINWQHLLKEAEKRGIKRMLFLGLALCEQFFALELPDRIRNEMGKEKALPKLISKVIGINFSETSEKGKGYSTFGLLWSMRENLSDKLRFTWHGLFAPKFDDFNFIQLPKPLTFLYTIIRPFRLVTKYFKP